MYKNEDLLEQEKHFAQVHFRGLIVVLLYLLIEAFRDFSMSTPIFSRTLALLAVLIAEQVFRPVDFFQKPAVVFGIKYFQIAALAVLILHSGYQNYEYVVYTILYFCIALEMSNFYDLTENGRIVLHNFLTILPLLAAGLVYIIINRTMGHVISVVVITCGMSISLFAMAKYFGKKDEKFERAIFAKDRMIDKAMDNNKEIMEKQDKLFYVNEQLGIKRIELEAANRRINGNILEINVQNDLLRFFNSTHDLRKINRFFAEKLVNDMGVKCAGMLKLEDSVADGVFEDYKRSNPEYDSENKYRISGDADETVYEAMYEAFVRPEFLERIGSEMYVCNHVNRADYPFFAAGHIKSFAARTIYIDERRTGVYVICHEEGNYFAEKQTYFDNMLYQLQVAMNNAFLYLRFEDMAKRDGLTGLYNRRLLNKAMEKYRHPDETVKKESLGAAMFDIDNFKSINDTYGHLFGDVAIKSVSDTIQRIASLQGGLSYRYGGEEFVVMFHDRTLEEIMPVVEEIHRTIRETPIVMGDISLMINTSAGVSVYPQISQNQVNIIDNADKAMYRAKTTGKGKIVVDS